MVGVSLLCLMASLLMIIIQSKQIKEEMKPYSKAVAVVAVIIHWLTMAAVPFVIVMVIWFAIHLIVG